MNSIRITIAIGTLLLAVVCCYWLFVVHPVVPVAVIGIVLVIGYFAGPEVIDLALGNTKHRKRGG
jgi:hypothetical protein